MMSSSISNTAAAAVRIALFSTFFIGVLGDDHKKMLNLEREFFNWRLNDRPDFASSIGHYRNSDRLEHYSLDYMIIRYERASEFLVALSGIDEGKLSKKDRVNYAIMKNMLNTFVDGFQWREWNYLTPMTWLEGLQRDPFYFVDSTPFDNRGDFENYVARLNAIPRLFKEYTELFQEAIRLNRTMHNVSMSRVPDQIEFILDQSPDDSIYSLPFMDTLQEPYFKNSISNMERLEIIRRGRMATTRVFTAYEKLNNFIKNQYLPNSRTGVSVGSLPGGKDYYKACLQWYLSLDMTPEEIHQVGLDEIKRVKNEMLKIMSRQNYNGTSIREYFKDLENKTETFFSTEEEVVEEYEKMISERIEPHLSKLFHDPPGLPIKVEKMRSDGSRAQYMSGTPDGLRPGVFMINTFRKWPRYTMISTAMHETNPGHHLQMSYASSADLPEFRKTIEFSDKYRVPFAFPLYTAYVEGWALYSEYLGLATGIYKDDYERMGYYDAEMIRACRMVADTGIHYFGWTKDQAVDLFMEYTSETREGIEVEIDRYITWPGQAVAYKIGELKIHELRKYAEKELGDHFDVRDFHKVVLENGGMPLDLLGKLVEDWVAHFHKTLKEKEQREMRGEEDEDDDECDCQDNNNQQQQQDKEHNSNKNNNKKRKSRCQRSTNNRNRDRAVVDIKNLGVGREETGYQVMNSQSSQSSQSESESRNSNSHKGSKNSAQSIYYFFNFNNRQQRRSISSSGIINSFLSLISNYWNFLPLYGYCYYIFVFLFIHCLISQLFFSFSDFSFSWSPSSFLLLLLDLLPDKIISPSPAENWNNLI